MSETRKTATATGKKAGKNFFQGHILSLDFFKRNWIYVVFIVSMALAYIGNKFACQSSIQELLTLKKQLIDAQTDLVSSSTKYNSMIRESEMVTLMNEHHIGLSAPQDPPFDLRGK